MLLILVPVVVLIIT